MELGSSGGMADPNGSDKVGLKGRKILGVKGVWVSWKSPLKRLDELDEDDELDELDEDELGLK
jgi:hypothetical protein